MSSDQGRADELAEHHEAPADAPSAREMVMLSKNKLFVILVMVWMMSCVTSAGVSWYFAGVSSDRSNAALAKIIAIQRDQGNKGLNVLYQSTLTRCLSGITTRNVLIHNAQVQRVHEGIDVQIPEPLPACKDSVKDPNITVGTAASTRG